jgi:hypothetical protein
VLELLAPEGPAGVTPTFLNLYTAQGEYRSTAIESLLFNRSACGLGFWRFEAYAGGKRIVVDVTVDPRFVQRFVYHSPTYQPSECWNTQVGDSLVRIYRGSRPASQKLERVLRACGTTAAEVHDERPERLPYPAWRSETEKE